MEFVIKDKILFRLLTEKKELLNELEKLGKEAIKMNEKATKIQGELNKLSLKRNNIIAKVHARMDKKKFDLKDFEEIGVVGIKGDKVFVRTINVVDDFKDKYLIDKREGKNNKKK